MNKNQLTTAAASEDSISSVVITVMYEMLTKM